MPLLSLPDETLLQIAHLVPREDRGVNAVINLGTTCKRLSRVCDTIIWSNYTLVIRKEEWGSSAPRTLEDWTARWNERNAHLLAKAALVRQLVIRDQSGRRREWPDAMAFSQDLMDAAMPGIEACTRLTSLRLFCGNTLGAFWPSQLWSLILQRFSMLRALSLDANFVDIPCPGADAVPKQLDTLCLQWCKGLADDLLSHEMLFARKVLFKSTWCESGSFTKDVRFTPRPQLAKHIKKLAVELSDRYLPGPVFDVAPIPHAVICIRIYINNEFKMHYPRDWRRVKPFIASLVTEDMVLYNVHRKRHIYIDRPSRIAKPNYRGKYQDHLRSEQLDIAEQEEMKDYYRDKWLG